MVTIVDNGLRTDQPGALYGGIKPKKVPPKPGPVVSQISVNGVEIGEDTDIVADLGLDSLKVMKIVESVEDRLDISIPLNILPDVRTVKDFASQIQKLIGDGR